MALLNQFQGWTWTDTDRRLSRDAASWVDQVFTVLFASQQSGTSSARPTTKLWTGRRYFDTTLGIPIWYVVSSTQWVNASGTPV
jgi:hypothetical protein